MNEPHPTDSPPSHSEDFTTMVPVWIDELVDGHLDETTRRRLLEHFEECPEGWRRCALAFLESQSFRRSFGSVLDELHATEPLSAADDAPAPGLTASWSHVPDADKPRWRRRIGPMVGNTAAMAASFVVAVALGLGLGRYVLDDRSVFDGAPLPDIARVDHPIGSGVRAGGGANLAELFPDMQRASMGPASVGRPQWNTVSNPNGVDDYWVLPRVASGSAESEMMEGVPHPVPEEMLNALRRAGHEVQHRCTPVVLPVEGGGKMVVPMEELQIRYVGEERFQ